MNVSFGIEFDDDVICAVDKLERDYVLKESNSCHLATEITQGPKQDVPCHRKEKYSRRKVDANLNSSGQRKIQTSDTDSGRMKLETVEDGMSLTVIKGHNSNNKVLSSVQDDPGDQDGVCTWNTPLLVSTPAVVGSRRSVANENAAKLDNADGAATHGCEQTVTPMQLKSARRPKAKNPEKTKLFDALLDASLNDGSPTKSPCLQNRLESPEFSGGHGSPSDGKGNSLTAASDPESK